MSDEGEDDGPPARSLLADASEAELGEVLSRNLRGAGRALGNPAAAGPGGLMPTLITRGLAVLGAAGELGRRREAAAPGQGYDLGEVLRRAAAALRGGSASAEAPLATGGDRAQDCPDSAAACEESHDGEDDGVSPG